MPDNPFVPSFGVSPAYLAGREDALSAIERVSLTFARTDYSRACLIVGSRGIGKTVLLNEIEDRAEALNWRMVKVTATKGFLDRMVSEQLRGLLAELRPTRNTKAAASIGINAGLIAGKSSIEKTTVSSTVEGLREHIYAISAAAPTEGLLFTIDEVNSRARDELEEFAAVYQHAIRDGLKVALVMCGIPASLGVLLNKDNGAVTFLNRARRIDIGLLDFPTAKTAFAETIKTRGTRTASNDVIDQMAALSKGYPFLVQEIGNKAWDVNPDSNEISLDDLRTVAAEAIAAMNNSVLRPIVASLSVKLREILSVIASNPGIRHAELSQQLGLATSALSGPLQRLIETGTVIRAERGVVRIAIPYLEQYLQTQEEPHSRTPSQLDVLDTYPEPQL